MESQNNPFLDNLFNGTPSVYNKDGGMTNSNMWTILNAYGLVFQDIQRTMQNVNNNTYIATASPEQLEGNFGTLIGFPRPPRLNSLANGDDIYRAILRALYQNYQLAPTTLSIQRAVAIILSFLVTDPTTADSYLEQDEVFLNIPDKQIQLTYAPIPVASSQFPNANINDPSTYIAFEPTGVLTPTAYDPSTNALTFTGNPTVAQKYTIVYYKNDTGQRGTNWINLTNSTATNVLPLDLKTTVNTFDNYQFSYWWNVYNRDGKGIEIIENLLVNEDQGIVWRLPEKVISYISPYNISGSIFQQTAIDAYNNVGQVYDINVVNDINPDVPISTIPLNYFSEVSINSTNYLIRYSADNALFVSYDTFQGSFSGFKKNNFSLAFSSVNYGTLDFFEIGANFDPTDLFGYGTKHIWLDVPYLQGNYTLNNDNYFDRVISLHEKVLFQDFFEQNNLNLNWNTSPLGDSVVAESILNPMDQKENCIKLFSTINGATTTTSAILPNGINISGNHISIDFLDVFNSGTSTYVDVLRASGTSASQIRFGIEPDINLPYYYQMVYSGTGLAEAPKNYLSQFPRSREWHRLTYDFGTGFQPSGLSLFSGISASIDQYQFLNISDMGFVSQLKGVSLNHSTIFPDYEFSYFDNVQVSYYDKNATLPEYRVGEQIALDWKGAMLDQSTALDNRVFRQEAIPAFNFLVTVLGWTDDLVFIVQQIVDKLKPAYAYASVLFEQEQSLYTTVRDSVLSNPATNWESGNINSNIIIVSGQSLSPNQPSGIPIGGGFLTVSPSGNVILS